MERITERAIGFLNEADPLETLATPLGIGLLTFYLGLLATAVSYSHNHLPRDQAVLWIAGSVVMALIAYACGMLAEAGEQT